MQDLFQRRQSLDLEKNGLFDPENVVTKADYVGEASYIIPATKTFMLGLQLSF